MKLKAKFNQIDLKTVKQALLCINRCVHAHPQFSHCPLDWRQNYRSHNPAEAPGISPEREKQLESEDDN